MVFVWCRREIKIIKEEGSQKEDRQEAEVKQFKDLNVDLKRRHQNDDHFNCSLCVVVKVSTFL